MDSDALSSLLDHEMYLGDLANNIREIDERIFHSIGKPYCEIILLNEFPESVMSGSHIARLATFAVKTPTVHASSAFTFPAKRECFIIWGTNVSERLEYLLMRDKIHGIGDTAIKKIWFVIALMLARLRVLAHKEWFVGVELRTRKSVLRYRRFFPDDGDEIGALRKLLFAFDSHVHIPLFATNPALRGDVCWTLRLVAEALDQEQPLEKALRFIVHD